MGVGGQYGVGSRCNLKYTRALIDAIHDGTLKNMPNEDWEPMSVFGLLIPKKSVNNVPIEVLQPEKAWAANGVSTDEFKEVTENLASMFRNNFKDYAGRCTAAVVAAGP